VRPIVSPDIQVLIVAAWPWSRQGAASARVGSNMYLFGGYSGISGSSFTPYLLNDLYASVFYAMCGHVCHVSCG
jgi:hypothetical protein